MCNVALQYNLTLDAQFPHQINDLQPDFIQEQNNLAWTPPWNLFEFLLQYSHENLYRMNHSPAKLFVVRGSNTSFSYRNNKVESLTCTP